MVRSLWIGPVVVALAVTGLAVSQPAPPAVESKERTLTVQEAEKAALKCRVLRTWRMPDGHKAFLVQALTTGEFITIAETTDPAPGTKAVATKIYHWGLHDQPPTGTPEIANNALILGNAVGRQIPVKALAPITVARTELPQPMTPTPPLVVKQGPSVSTPVPASVKPPVPVVTAPKPLEVKPPVAVATPPKPLEVKPPVAVAPLEVKPPVAVVPPSKPVDIKSPVVVAPPPKPPESKPFVVTTPLPPLPSLPPAAPPASQPFAVTTQLPPLPATVPETKPAMPVVIAKGPNTTTAPQAVPATVPETKPAAPVVIAKGVDKTTAPQTVPTTVPETKPATSVVIAKGTTSTTAPPPPDWRASWGKADPSKTPSSTPPVPPPSAVTPPANTGKVTSAPTGLVMQGSDPLASPDQYTKLPTAMKVAQQPSTLAVSPPPAPVKPNVPTPAPLPGTPLPPLPPVQSAVNKTDDKVPAKPPVQVALNTVESVPLPPLPPTYPNSKPASTPIKPVVPPKPLTLPPASTSAPVQSVAPPKPLQLPPAMTSPPALPSKPATPPAPRMVTIPDDGSNAFGTAPTPPQKGATTQPPQSPAQANATPQTYYPTARPPIMYQPPRMDQGVSPAMENAFTRTGTERPIPANFGPSAQMPNAFHDGNTAVVAAPPTMPNQYTMYPQLQAGMDRGPVVRTGAVGGPPVSTSLPQLMAILRDSLYPTQREAAAEALSSHDWHAQPQIADILVKAAKDDPAPTVRAECLRSLSRMAVTTAPAIGVCQALKTDSDPQVRREAEQALQIIMSSNGNANSGVHQASMTAPR